MALMMTDVAQKRFRKLESRKSSRKFESLKKFVVVCFDARTRLLVVELVTPCFRDRRILRLNTPKVTMDYLKI